MDVDLAAVDQQTILHIHAAACAPLTPGDAHLAAVVGMNQFNILVPGFDIFEHWVDVVPPLMDPEQALQGLPRPTGHFGHRLCQLQALLTVAQRRLRRRMRFIQCLHLLGYPTDCTDHDVDLVAQIVLIRVFRQLVAQSHVGLLRHQGQHMDDIPDPLHRSTKDEQQRNPGYQHPEQPHDDGVQSRIVDRLNLISDPVHHQQLEAWMIRRRWQRKYLEPVGTGLHALRCLQQLGQAHPRVEFNQGGKHTALVRDCRDVLTPDCQVTTAIA